MKLKLIFNCSLLFCLNSVGSLPWQLENLPRYPDVYNNEATLQQFPKRQYQDWNQQLNNNDRSYPNWQYPVPITGSHNQGLTQNWPESRYKPNAPETQSYYSKYPIVPDNQNSNTPSMQIDWQNVNLQPVQNEPALNELTTVSNKQYFNPHHQPNQWNPTYENFNTRPQDIEENNQQPENNKKNDNFFPPIPSVPKKPLNTENSNAIVIDDSSSPRSLPLLESKSELRAVPPVSINSYDRYLASASNPVETVSTMPEEPIKLQIKNLISDLKTRGILSSGKRKRYMIVHSNGTIEHVNTLQAITKIHPNYVLVHASGMVNNPEKGRHTIDEPAVQQTPLFDKTTVQEMNASEITNPNIETVSINNLQNASGIESIPTENFSENIKSTPFKISKEIIPDTETPVKENNDDTEISKNIAVKSTYSDGQFNIALTSTNKDSIPIKSTHTNSPEEILPDTKIPVEKLKSDSEIIKNIPRKLTNSDWKYNITLTPTNKDSIPIDIPPGGKVFVSVNSHLLAPSNNLPDVHSSVPRLNDTDSKFDISLNETRVATDLKEPEESSTGEILPLVSAEAISEVKVPSDSNINASSEVKVPSESNINASSEVKVPSESNITSTSFNSSKSILDGISNVGNIDISKVKTEKNPIIWFNSSEKDFWKKLSGNDKGFDAVYFFQIESPKQIENETTRTVYPNGTIIEEITSYIWSPGEDNPTVTTRTKIIQPEDTSKSIT